ncbi:hypothetical protein [Aquisphaera insulae]|uniref:hypothetical protein n=1 Tax=Aquisphaera insulae TaxID=2712864 RepID=UPI0013EDFE3E|nr:hypothetical protein [Aquisphaera insulae]
MSTNYPSGPFGESPRKRCPICDKPVYSSAGVHPQCAVKQIESVVPPPVPGPDGPMPVVAPSADSDK